MFCRLSLFAVFVSISAWTVIADEEPDRPSATHRGQSDESQRIEGDFENGPGGPPPDHALACIRGDHVRFLTTEFRKALKSEVRTIEENGDDEREEIVREVRRYQNNVSEMPIARIRAFIAGKQLIEDELCDALKVTRHVLVSRDGRRVDRFYLQIVREDTLVLVPQADMPLAAMPADGLPIHIISAPRRDAVAENYEFNPYASKPRARRPAEQGRYQGDDPRPRNGLR